MFKRSVVSTQYSKQGPEIIVEKIDPDLESGENYFDGLMKLKTLVPRKIPENI
jgi:hypothetical protein